MSCAHIADNTGTVEETVRGMTNKMEESKAGLGNRNVRERGLLFYIGWSEKDIQIRDIRAEILRAEGSKTKRRSSN